MRYKRRDPPRCGADRARAARVDGF